MIAYTALEEQNELMFRAERVRDTLRGSRGGRRGQNVQNEPLRQEWLITHLAIHPTRLLQVPLAKLPEDASATEYLASLQSVEMPALDLGTTDRRVRLPAGASVMASLCSVSPQEK